MNFYSVTIETRMHGAIGAYTPRTYQVIATARDTAAETAMHAAHGDAWQTGMGVEVFERPADEVDTMTLSYVTTALWSSTDEDGAPLDDRASPHDVAPEAWASARSDCAAFLSQAGALLKSCGMSPETAGHDFWLTRNGHGAGFWDRGLGVIGRQMSELSKTYGSIDPCVGDGGKVYF